MATTSMKPKRRGAGAPRLLLAAAALLLATAADRAWAAAPWSLELNKLEPLTQGGPGCRAYFVVHNPDTQEVDPLRIDLVVFGTDGIIARRLALDLGPLPAGKTAVKLFDLQGVTCDAIGRVLINGVLACKGGDVTPASPATPDQELAACLDRLAVSSRIASVPVLK